jgi:hypothetical protein
MAFKNPLCFDSPLHRPKMGRAKGSHSSIGADIRLNSSIPAEK